MANVDSGPITISIPPGTPKLTREQAKVFDVAISICRLRAYYDKNDPRGRSALSYLNEVMEEFGGELTEVEYEEVRHLLAVELTREG